MRPTSNPGPRAQLVPAQLDEEGEGARTLAHQAELRQLAGGFVEGAL